MARATDEHHLLFAALKGWTLVTNNAKDFILLHDAWHRWSKAWQVAPLHAGILVARADWNANRLAGEVNDFFARQLTIVNCLYTLDAAQGWVLRPATP
jgi:hypothetical protein